MLGARWHLFTDPLLSLQEFVDEYANTCPAHLSVAVSGAESVDTPTGICLRVSDGLTLTVEYVYIQHPDADDDDDGSVASPVPTSFQGGDSTDDPIDSSEGSEVTGRCGWKGAAELAATGPAGQLVDGVAKYVCRGPRGNPDPHQLLLPSWRRSGALPWAWLLIESALSPSLWPKLCGSSLVDQDRHTDQVPLTAAECESVFGLDAPSPGTAHPDPVWARLLLVTVNVQSLSDRAGDTAAAPDSNFPGRAAYLREQLADLRVHVAALQETRATADATISSRPHLRFCAARDAGGNYGTELWFSRELPYCHAGTASCFFHPADFLVLHASPRLIIVRFWRASTAILFVSLHAPTAGSPERNEWWKALRRRLERLQCCPAWRFQRQL
eukprot:s5273_g7.t1